MATKYKTLSVFAKCSDMCTIGTETEDFTKLKHSGYVLDGLGIGDGDYIDFNIDLKTGKIIGWKELTDEQIEEIFRQG